MNTSTGIDIDALSARLRDVGRFGNYDGAAIEKIMLEAAAASRRACAT